MAKTIKFFIFVPALATAAQGQTQAKIAALCDSLMAHFSTVADTPRLAVLPFAYDGDSSLNGPGRTVAECVVAQLKKIRKIKLVDRMNFHKAVMELKLSGASLVDQNTALAMGKLEAAQYLLIGGVGTALGEAKITAQILEVETGKIVTATEIMTNVINLQQYARELLVEKAQVQSSVFRSAVLPGWGQMYTEHYVRGYVCLAAFLGMAGATIYEAQLTANAKKKYHDYNDFLYTDAWTAEAHSDPSFNQKSMERDSLNYKDYSRKYDRMVLAGAAAVGVWALNIIDATLCGMQAKRKFGPYFSGDIKGGAEAGIAWRF